MKVGSRGGAPCHTKSHSMFNPAQSTKRPAKTRIFKSFVKQACSKENSETRASKLMKPLSSRVP